MESSLERLKFKRLNIQKGWDGKKISQDSLLGEEGLENSEAILWTFFFNIENTYWIVLIPEIYLLISEVLEKEENRVPYSQNLALALVYIFVCFIPTSFRHK